MQKTHQVADALISHILALSGSKILTLSHIHRAEPFVVDVSETGEFGYEMGVKALFMAKLHSALAEGGVLVIRHFLPMKVERKMPNGKILWIPKKNIYMVALGQMRWLVLPKEDVEWACTTDNSTKASIAPEPDVYYRELPINLVEKV